MPSDDDKNGPKINRRVAAIAFADVVGYSMLTAPDEARTHTHWMNVLETVIRPHARNRHGTLVKSTGDGVLMEFPSAFEAVEWAQAVQHSLVGRSTEQDQPHEPISLR